MRKFNLIFIIPLFLMLVTACGGRETLETETKPEPPTSQAATAQSQAPVEPEQATAADAEAANPVESEAPPTIEAEKAEPAVAETIDADETIPDASSATDLRPYARSFLVRYDIECCGGTVFDEIQLLFDATQVQIPGDYPSPFSDIFTITGGCSSVPPIPAEYNCFSIGTKDEIPDNFTLNIPEGEILLTQSDGSISPGPFFLEVSKSDLVDKEEFLASIEPTSEPVQGPSLNAETYLMSALPKALEITVAVDQITKILRNPQADRLAWVATMEPHANAAQAGYEALVALNPPPEFQQVHTTLLEGANACAQGAGQIVTGIKGPDQAALDASGPLMKTCTEKVIQAVQLIQQALTKQAVAPTQSAESNADPISGDLPLFPILKSGKWGFINKAGQVVIEPQFTGVHRFSFPTFKEGLEPVNVGKGANAQWGYIDPTGQFVIQPQYKYAVQFSEGLSNFVIDDKTGYMRPDGTVVIEPVVTDNSFPFQEGMANFNINGKWGYYDATGAVAIEPQFDEAWAFSEGLAAVRVGNKWGYIDKTGQFVIQPQFDKFKNFSEGLAAVESEGQVKYIDPSGQVVLDPPIAGASYYSFSEGLAAVKVGEKYGFMDKTGQMVIEPQFDGAGSFAEGLAWVEIGNQYGYIDPGGQIVFQLEFDFSVDSNRALIPGGFSDGLAMIKVNGKFGYIDRTGNFIWKPTE